MKKIQPVVPERWKNVKWDFRRRVQWLTHDQQSEFLVTGTVAAAHD